MCKYRWKGSWNEMVRGSRGQRQVSDINGRFLWGSQRALKICDQGLKMGAGRSEFGKMAKVYCSQTRLLGFGTGLE